MALYTIGGASRDASDASKKSVGNARLQKYATRHPAPPVRPPTPAAAPAARGARRRHHGAGLPPPPLPASPGSSAPPPPPPATRRRHPPPTDGRSRSPPPAARGVPPLPPLPPTPPTVGGRPYRWAAPLRTVAIGDVHGDFEALTAALTLAGVLAADGGWGGGGTALVQVGDVLDGWEGERECWALLLRLQAEAPAAGGRVHLLMGNHELANVLGLVRPPPTPPPTPSMATGRGRSPPPPGWPPWPDAHLYTAPSRRDALRPGGAFATALSTAVAPAVLLGDTAYVHGGLTPAVFRPPAARAVLTPTLWGRLWAAAPPAARAAAVRRALDGWAPALAAYLDGSAADVPRDLEAALWDRTWSVGGGGGSSLQGGTTSWPLAPTGGGGGGKRPPTRPRRRCSTACSRPLACGGWSLATRCRWGGCGRLGVGASGVWTRA
ncbi:hypothetical protein BU14_0291s0006 [Porphyra umbilicalis]|uniref:Calcineurin-like phosphoesterase domain-containing protein n=1 Tax=Porphyra umbilicalis TaxID=2786 RepID=A0A1X6P0N3_PORUM|nr:hypothetical protein BU14_0291s0006 [Porphyra umbilicalis]|eukprot:OSX74387.1 hypothetical protein BU14_0291s0006 [Porphyra umbilicalis]